MNELMYESKNAFVVQLEYCKSKLVDEVERVEKKPKSVVV
jgi:hypothetical protein